MRCKGIASIQREINKVIVNKYPNDWKFKIRDEDLREEVRVLLQMSGREWCDARAGTCICKKEGEKS